MDAEQLAPDLRLTLARIEPTYTPYQRRWQWPCKVWLRSGQVVERVLMCGLTAEVEEHFRIHALPISSSFRVADVLKLAESPHRLPGRFANELYLGGETGMGYFAFTVKFYSGMWRHYVSSGCLDFVDFPLFMSPKWVHSVEGGHRKEHHHKCPDFRVCYFKG